MQNQTLPYSQIYLIPDVLMNSKQQWIERNLAEQNVHFSNLFLNFLWHEEKTNTSGLLKPL